MSDYSECWYKYHENEIKKEALANKYRVKLAKELTVDQMIALMFYGFINKQSDDYVIQIAEKYLV